MTILKRRAKAGVVESMQTVGEVEGQICCIVCILLFPSVMHSFVSFSRMHDDDKSRKAGGGCLESLHTVGKSRDESLHCMSQKRKGK